MVDQGEGLVIALQLTIIGLGMVFAALTILVFLLGWFKRLDEMISKRSKPVEAPAKAPIPIAQPVLKPSADGIPPEVVAVISATVAVAIARRIRVKRIRYLGTPGEPTWARQGRVTIMASHVTRR